MNLGKGEAMWPTMANGLILPWKEAVLRRFTLRSALPSACVFFQGVVC